MTKLLAYRNIMYGAQRLTLSVTDDRDLIGKFVVIVKATNGDELEYHTARTERQAAQIFSELVEKYNNVYITNADPARLDFYDYCKPENAQQQLNQAREAHPGTGWRIMSEADYYNKQRALLLTGPVEITESDYNYYFNAMRPARWVNWYGVESFINPEPITGTLYKQYAKYKGKFYAATIDLADENTFLDNVLPKLETAAINKALEIRYYKPRRPAFYHPEKGWLAFKNDIEEGANEPYTPLGKRAALEAILAAGGFVDFDGIVFIKKF